MSIESWRSAVAEALDGMPGLSCPDPYITDQVNPPQAVIYINQISYDVTFARGADSFEFSIMVLDQRTDERATQRRLDVWRDGTLEGSIKHVLENDPAVAAECDYTRVVSASELTEATVSGVGLLVVEFLGEVVL